MLALLARPDVEASVSWSPLDPRWYADIAGARSDAGPLIVPEAALGIAVVFRAVNVLAHAIASIPLVVYRRTADEGKERAREHPAYDLLHDKPNAWQTSFRWRHLAMTHAILWGDHYSEILPGPGGIGQLVPLPPDTTRIVDQLGDGRLIYETQDRTVRGFGPPRRIVQDEILHIRGFSIDGKKGIPLTRLARNAMGLALAAERHGSMFLRRGARFSGVLTTAAHMDDVHRKANEEAWQRAYGGTAGSGMAPLLTGGMKFESISANNRESQWIESRTFQVEELLRFIGVPGVLCGYADKTATYASAEQFFLSFVTHTVRPWTENIRQELNGSVITEAPAFFADFILEGLLRGDIKTRYAAHQLAILSGFKTRNEVRVEENMNRGPEELDTFLEPANMFPAGDDREDREASAGALPPRPAPAPAREDGEEARRAQLARIAQRTVERLVAREVAAIWGSGGKLGAAQRFAGNAAGWHDWKVRFYQEHARSIASDLGVSEAVARGYTEVQEARLGAGPDGFADFEAESIAALARLIPG